MSVGRLRAFDLRKSTVVVGRVEAEREDPVIAVSCPFLGRDIQTGRNVRGVPQALTRAIWKQAQHKP
ncbi:MAG: hypothetical protein ACN6OP_27230 [Pseudomonadales bacterium]